MLGAGDTAPLMEHLPCGSHPLTCAKVRAPDWQNNQHPPRQYCHLASSSLSQLRGKRSCGTSLTWTSLLPPTGPDPENPGSGQVKQTGKRTASHTFHHTGFPGGSDGRESDCNAGNLDLIPGSGRSPGGGHGPLQYSCLENPMDRGAWWATVHGVAKSRT